MPGRLSRQTGQRPQHRPKTGCLSRSGLAELRYQLAQAVVRRGLAL